MKAYRVIWDSPEGVVVGFVPPDDVETDEFELLSDDGGSLVFTKGMRMHITSNPQFEETGYNRESPDLDVWRDENEFFAWLAEMEA